jgi:hypothetical protein
MEDPAFTAELEIEVSLLDMEIIKAKAKVLSPGDYPPAFEPPSLAKLAGIRVGQGLKKIISGLIPEREDGPPWAHLVLEACEAVILALTQDMMAHPQGLGEGAITRSGEGDISLTPWLISEEGTEEFAKLNPRLKGSCIAFPKE